MVKARSLSRRLAVLAIAFVAVPLAIYITLRDAASERQALLLDSVQEQGRIVASALGPSLQQQDASPLPHLAEELARYGNATTRLKVLFRPAGETGASGF